MSTSGSTASSLLIGLRNPLAIVSLGFLVLLTLAAIFAPWIMPYSPTTQNLRAALGGPTATHWLGTDEVGRDIFTRLIYGGRVSLMAGFQCVIVALALGVTAGVIAGYYGGRINVMLDRLSDLLLSTPGVIMLLTVLAVFGPNMTAAMITLGILLSPDFMRLSRASTMAARSELYVDAAVVFGLSNRRVIFRHVLPNVIGPVIVRATTVIGTALMVEAGLSFLGLGPRPPTPSWGSMIAAAGKTIYTQTWYLVPTGGIIALTILAFNLLGDAIYDATSPVSRHVVKPNKAASYRAPARVAPAPDAPRPLLSVRDLEVSFPGGGETGWQPVVTGVDFDLHEREALGVVGESGSGKTMTMLAMLGLVPSPGRVTRGSIIFDGHELLDGTGDAAFRRIRGAQIGFVAQEPMVSLDPVFNVGQQIAEPIRRHLGLNRRQARQRVLELLDLVGMPDPRLTANSFPHQLSGGMAQRVSIALALGSRPRLLVADEPTTALDVTIQAEILDLLRSLQKELSMAVVLVTHDFGVLADFCSASVVMYAGQVVEQGPVTDVLGRPLMPYTDGLLRSNPHGIRQDRKLYAISGTVPGFGQWPRGCHFQDRCPLTIDACRAAPVPMQVVGDRGHAARCIRIETMLERKVS